ncbi:uncharacterized protein LOC103153133 isoform X1 [Poecilia formosa]|uniref:uncharacterized protein LOC103153133 isoform X1 n=2 Tax=Poecilia formosa TaxID=48698 RepID=UPI0007B96B13|nr:PREDICTED: uncharacterized protein LOC103153133 isoform X1 [Poecilia formosa]
MGLLAQMYTPRFLLLPVGSQIQLHVSYSAGGGAQQLNTETTENQPPMSPKPQVVLQDMEALGNRLVGFGTHSSLTYRELYESREQKIRSYRELLRRLRDRKADSQLGKLKQYVLTMDRVQRSGSALSSKTSRELVSASSTTRPPPSHPTAQPSSAAARRVRIICPAAQTSSESLPISLPPEQRAWLSKVLFTRDATGKFILSNNLQLWYNPPGPSLTYSQRPTSPNDFFQRRFFLWAPVRMWQYRLKCPSCSHNLTSCSLYKTVHRVLDLDGWYYMGTEYLECM